MDVVGEGDEVRDLTGKVAVSPQCGSRGGQGLSIHHDRVGMQKVRQFEKARKRQLLLRTAMSTL
jgi:hypothetical protein